MEDLRGKRLCSACGPMKYSDGTPTKDGKWHGEFDRVFLPLGMKDSNELQQNLYQFTGTTVWFRHPLNRSMLYTEGVQYFAENAGNGAYWVLDIIATEYFELAQSEGFITISLTVSDGRGKIVVEDGNKIPLKERDIEWTDCPEGEWKFFLTDNVLLLPSEY